MVKRVLMIAFHYPPMRGSSGIQRTLKFAQYLPRFGWQPTVLSAKPQAYEEISGAEVAAAAAGPAAYLVRRSLALDAARHFAIGGRYPSWLAQPDRWINWWLSAVPAGLRLIREQRPDVIWSSYPIATAHLVGLALHRLSGIPWVADQRDPLVEHDYPPDPRRHRIHRWIENQAARRSAAMVCTTPGALGGLRQRFPALPAQQLVLIENGYDESNFIDAEQGCGALQRTRTQAAAAPFRLLHSGLIYPSERDPGPLFEALARLRQAGAIAPASFQLVLRASGHDDYLLPLMRRHGVEALVELAPPLPYNEALAEMLGADGLLLLQAANCNGQIPAKLYEYLRARRPLLALTDPAGDTAAALRGAGIDTIGVLASADDIAATLTRFLRLCGAGLAPTASEAVIARHSRSARTQEFAALLDRVVLDRISPDRISLKPDRKEPT